MNWSELKQKATPYIEKAMPYVEKTKIYGGKALDFTQKQLHNTPIIVKNIDEYTNLVVSKRFILIGYDEYDPVAQQLLLWMPIWSTQAWSDNAKLRFYTSTAAPELAAHLSMTPPIDMRVYYEGNEVARYNDLESIKNWWKNRNYVTIASETQNKS